MGSRHTLFVPSPQQDGVSNPSPEGAGVSVMSPAEFMRLVGEATETSSSTDEFIDKLKKFVPH